MSWAETGGTIGDLRIIEILAYKSYAIKVSSMYLSNLFPNIFICST